MLSPQDPTNHLPTPGNQMEGNQAFFVSIAKGMGIPLIDVIGFMVFPVKCKQEEGVDTIKQPIEGLITLGQTLQYQRDKLTHLRHSLQCYQG